MTIQPQLEGLDNFSPRFGDGFLADHVGRIINDPHIAIVELVANCWDAGANQVVILWPDTSPNHMEIRDNGVGMTYGQFTEFWTELNFNRVDRIGPDVNFPSDYVGNHRRAFGRNGKGRHSVFCFADQYFVETWRDGEACRFKVIRSFGNGPFEISLESRFEKEGHGTSISTNLTRNHVPVAALRDLIGSKFFADPSFGIYVNGESVQMIDLQRLETEELAVDGVGTVLIHRVDSQKIGRTSQQHGVAWWVNRRLVGEQSWKGIDISYLDARTTAAKRYTFVIEADILVDQVEADWGWFRDSQKTDMVISAVNKRILALIHDLMQDVRKERKVAALQENRDALRELPTVSQYVVGRFLDGVQVRCPTIKPEHLAQTVEVLANLEKSRCGYALLEQIAKLRPGELDKLNELLAQWTVQDVQTVLDELRWRLEWIKRLELLAENPSSDELHEIQPLFEKGLWIFGPEYEGADFIANRSLVSVVRDFLKGEPGLLTTPRRRPDIVSMPSSSIGIYERPFYDDRGEPNGSAKILIIELKRGGFEITRKERQQAQDYASEIRRSGKVQRTTQIVGFVLGASIAEDAVEPIREGDMTVIYSRTYSAVLLQAHARTFYLLRRLQDEYGERLTDPDVEAVIGTPEQLVLERIQAM